MPEENPAQNTQSLNTGALGVGLSENPASTALTQTPQITTQQSGSSKSKNIIAIIFGILIMVGGILAGVLLVGRAQDIREKAAEDVCLLSPENCVIIQDPENSGSYKVDGIAYNVFLTDTQVRAFDLSVTQDGCYQVLTQGDTVYWNKIGTSSDCNDLVNIQIWLTQLPTQSTPPTQSQCQTIKIYDTDWNLLSAEDINNLSPRDTIYLTAEGTTTNGQITQAKFTVNDTERSPVSTKKPGSNEFFDEYVIPSGTSQLNVTVKITNNTSSVQPAKTIDLLVNGQSIGSFDIPQLDPLTNVEMGNINLPEGDFTWSITGDVLCQGDSGGTTHETTLCQSYNFTVNAQEPNPTPIPTVIPSLNPTANPTLTSVPTDVPTTSLPTPTSVSETSNLPQSTSAPAQLPDSGISFPTIFSLGIGITIILGAFLMAI